MKREADSILFEPEDRLAPAELPECTSLGDALNIYRMLSDSRRRYYSQLGIMLAFDRDDLISCDPETWTRVEDKAHRLRRLGEQLLDEAGDKVVELMMTGIPGLDLERVHEK